VTECQTKSKLIKKVAEIYEWLDLQICNNSDLVGKCDVCGRCCDFGKPAPASEQGFDHRLFVTPPEVMYLAAKLGSENINPPHVWRINPPHKWRIKPMPTSSGSTTLTIKCPYNIDSKCSVYKYRFAGCRIFYCKGDKDFQSELSESALKKFKSICEQFQIPYRYTDLATALNL